MNSNDDVGGERRRREQVADLQAALDQARREARTDALTGIPNTRAYVEDLHSLDEEARSTDQPYAVIFFDVDNFHSLNRARSDVDGDHTLRVVATILSEQCRAGDMLYRKGGEEFVTLLPGTTLAEAMQIADRIRRSIEGAGIPHGGGQQNVTISAGVTVFDHERHPTADDVVAEASTLMAEAKTNGRNRVVGPSSD
jgi:diguanylate cyclase (GGDEF)-like protein